MNTENTPKLIMKKFYEGFGVTDALVEFSDKLNGPQPDQSYPRYAGLQPCWQWLGNLNNCGYGLIPVRGRSLLAHRVAFTHYKGEIPYRMQVRHVCDNRSCVNPDHLLLGSHSDNMKDKSERMKMMKVASAIAKSKDTACVEAY